MNGFYQLNNEVLTFNLSKDIQKILFNHYIMRKENAQRLTNELPKGHFYLTTREVSLELEISLKQSKTLIDKFTEMGIIEPILLSDNKMQKSIYAYTTITKETVEAPIPNGSEDAMETVESEKADETGEETVKPLFPNGSEGITETVEDEKQDKKDKETVKVPFIKALEVSKETVESENKHIGTSFGTMKETVQETVKSPFPKGSQGVMETNEETVDLKKETVKPLFPNGSEGVTETVQKELLKRIKDIKNINNKTYVQNAESEDEKPVEEISKPFDKLLLEKLTDEVWQLYPKKIGKADAMKKIPKLIKQVGYDQLVRSVLRYADQVKGKDPQFTKSGSTFFNGGYMDYLDKEFAEREAGSPQTPQIAPKAAAGRPNKFVDGCMKRNLNFEELEALEQQHIEEKYQALKQEGIKKA